MFNLISKLKYRTSWRRRQIVAAAAFLHGTLTEDEAYMLLRAAQKRLGSWCLVSIDARDVLARLRDQYVDQPEFEGIAADAAERVYSKWPGDDSDFTSAQIDWAVEIAEGYAERDGVPLVDLDEEAGDVAV